VRLKRAVIGRYADFTLALGYYIPDLFFTSFLEPRLSSFSSVEEFKAAVFQTTN